MQIVDLVPFKKRPANEIRNTDILSRFILFKIEKRAMIKPVERSKDALRGEK